MKINLYSIFIASVLNIIFVLGSTWGYALLLKVLFNTETGGGVDGVFIFLYLIGYIPAVIIGCFISYLTSTWLSNRVAFRSQNTSQKIIDYIISLAISVVIYFTWIYFIENIFS